MLQIQTLLIQIQILLVTFIWIRILLFNLIRIEIQLFDTDPDPYRFKEVMYLKTVLCINLNLIFLVSRSNRTQPKGILC